MKKPATVTVETERLVVMGRSVHLIERWCHYCNADVKLVAVAEASLIAGASERTIFRLAETAEIHFIETSEGKAMFCIDSLLQQRNRLTSHAGV